MYNRYIPQPDGSYRRNQVPESRGQESSRRSASPPAPPLCPPPDSCDDHPEANGKHPPSRRESSIGSFLRQLLPKNLDTGDLLIIILLLLMAADGTDDQNTAMLTLALYLFL